MAGRLVLHRSERTVLTVDDLVTHEIGSPVAVSLLVPSPLVGCLLTRPESRAARFLRPTPALLR